jgi:pimeloyl-ACP methyl ester carboxylesterase
MTQGWSALEVLGEAGEDGDALGWERRCAESAIEAAGGARVLVIGKSLASLLAGEISARDLPAVWLTPLLDQPSVIDGLARARRPVLLVGGDADPTWQPASLPHGPQIEMLELPGADHALQVPGDPVASLGALGRLAEAIARFVKRI